ncbi:MAG: hypothetical protein ACJ75H_13010 [Thermoanaerobaculia bacterium]
MPEGTRLVLYAPYVRGKKGEYKKQLAQMAREGFMRARRKPSRAICPSCFLYSPFLPRT